MGKKEKVLQTIAETDIFQPNFPKIFAVEEISRVLGRRFRTVEYLQKLYQYREQKYQSIAGEISNQLDVGSVLKNFVDILLEKGASEFTQSLFITAFSYKNPDYLAELKTIFSSEKKRQRYLKANFRKISQISQENLRGLEKGKKMVEDLVIIGGGPLSVLAAQILSQFRRVTIITEDLNVGYNWIGRGFFYINSSSTQDPRQSGGPRFPVVNGTTTTPVTASGINTALGLEDVCTYYDTLEIPCEDGSKKYVSGRALGEVTATNLGILADNFYVGQRVRAVVPINGPDGSPMQRIELEDVSTGKIRNIYSNTVLNVTGPGREVCGIDDPLLKKNYEEGASEIKKQCLNPKTNFKLPQVLSLTSLEKLTALWFEQGYKAEKWPFRELFSLTPDGRIPNIAVIGTGDSGLVLTEFLLKLGPNSAYPKKLSLVLPKITFFGARTVDKEKIKKTLRPRYRGAFTGDISSKVKLVDGKVDQFITDLGSTDSRRFILGVNGKLVTEESFDYVFVATGLQKPNNSGIRNLITDADNQNVGKGSTKQSIYYGGTASNLDFEELPEDLRNIVNALGIRENTVALWLWAVLLERLCWKILAQDGVNVEYVKQVQAKG